MKVLFITSNRLGDAVLSTGLLSYIVRTHPGAAITIVCGTLPAPIFEGVPGLERIITLKKRRWNLHWFDLWRQVVRTRWDIVVDLRDSAVSRLIPARQRFIYSRRIDHNLHKVEQNAAVMNLATPPAPTIFPTPEQTSRAQELLSGGGPILGIGPTANWIAKTWPAERFVQLIAALTAPDGILPGARVAVFAAAGEETAAYEVLRSVPPARQIDMIAKTDPGTAAACLARCALFIGNDSGLMHTVAAAGTPTIGLFGPSWPHLYGPWGDHTTFVRTPETFAELTNYPGYNAGTCGCLMNSLTVENVWQATQQFWLAHKSKTGAV